MIGRHVLCAHHLRPTGFAWQLLWAVLPGKTAETEANRCARVEGVDASFLFPGLRAPDTEAPPPPSQIPSFRLSIGPGRPLSTTNL